MKRVEQVVLIRPNLGDFRSRDAMEPLAAAQLKALTPPAIRFELVDERLQAIDALPDADLVAFSVETFTARRAYELADSLRQRRIPVVMGGHHPSLCPEEALRYADAVVVGDAESTWPRLLSDFAAGRMQRQYRDAHPVPTLRVRPDRSVFSGKRYAPISLVEHARGCRFACDFCSVHAVYGNRRVTHSVAATLEDLFSTRHRRVFFADDNLFISHRRLVALLEELASRNLALPPTQRRRWCCQISIDVCRDERLLDLMAESGCFLVVVGFESLRRGNLREMAKGWNRGRHLYEQAIHRLHRRGILVYGSFVFGYGEDSYSSFAETAEFARGERLCIANFNPLTPIPGTALFDRLRAQGRLLHNRWWLDPGYRYGQATFRPQGMTPEQLERGCFEARQRFYSAPSIAERLLPQPLGPVPWAHLGTALLANWVSRAEIQSKQGKRLGTTVGLHEAYADQA